MPRRKRTTPQNEGQRKCRRADDKDVDTLVISDSENEEDEDALSKFSSREARWRERGARTHMQDMTEEEMLDLAMQLSKQEASSAAQRQQLEDDDIQKAIAESLHVSHSQDFDENAESTSCMAKTSQDPSTVTVRLRRKLCFPNKSEMDREQDEEVNSEAECDEDCTQEDKQLLPMPDMSQRTLSQPSPPSPALPSVPSTASHGCQSLQGKDQDEQASNADSPENEPSQCHSRTPCSPAVLRRCAVRLCKESMNTRRDSANPQTTQNSSLSLTSPSRSYLAQQESLSPLKSPVFTKMDPKESTALSENDKDKNTDAVCTPKEDDKGEACKQSSSHKEPIESRDHQKRLSLCRKAQPSSRISVPEDSLKQEAVQPKQLRNGSSRGPSLNAAPEKVPNSEVIPVPADNKPLEFTSHMILHLSDNDDDDDDEEEEKIEAPSPVFHQECVPHTGHPTQLSPTQPCYSPPTAKTTEVCSRTKDSESQNICTRRKFTSKTAYPAESYQVKIEVEKKPACDSASMQQLDEKRDGFVSYYWGVPFCPRGQNPDEYTTVILSQLEVYEKSLKKAQHQLLHKSEWGLPLFPCPAERPLNRRMKCHRAPQLLEEEEEEEVAAEKEEEEQKKAEKEGEERVESQSISEEAGEDGQNETYVVVSSPETQEDLGRKSPLCFRQHKTSDAIKPSSWRKSIPNDLSEDTQIQQSDEQNKIQDEKYDVESTVCPETQMSEDNTPELMVTSPAQPQSREENEGMEVDEEVAEDEERMEQEQTEEEQQREPVSPQSQTVECPMCSHFFPINKIEMHAAFCDGTTEEQELQGEQSQVAALRRRNRRVEMEAIRPKSENRLMQQEKCYLCLRFFSSKEYSDHVDKCLKQKRPKSNQGNGLISALHQAEQVDIGDDDKAGPSDVSTKNHGVLAECSALAEAVGDRDCPANFCISSSPIKSFTPISDVTDCLIDFQQQYSDRRLGRKRKFKR